VCMCVPGTQCACNILCVRRLFKPVLSNAYVYEVCDVCAHAVYNCDIVR